MYDKGKIIIGLVVFLGLATLPIWYTIGTGGAAGVPKLTYPAGEKQCVEPKQLMRESHMELLSQWRDSVVRDGNRVYTSSSGRTFNMSLTGECLGCHSKPAEFCDKCHAYMDVKPYCWDCHLIPKENA